MSKTKRHIFFKVKEQKSKKNEIKYVLLSLYLKIKTCL